MNIIILGPQGSGKSTQAELLAKRLELPHLQTGEICRNIASRDDDFGREIKRIIGSGQLVDDERMIKIVNELVAKPEIQKGFVLEGFPRNIYQTRNLLVCLDYVFYIQLSDEEAKKRLLGRARIEKRVDDTLEIIEKRLRVYHQEIDPILDFYRGTGILREIEGNQIISKIHEEIWRKLNGKSVVV